MSRIRLFFDRLGRSTHARKAGRAQLKAAKSGDRDQYLGLAAGYFNQVLAYFGTTRAEPEERSVARTVQLFECLWRNLGYAERLSDFEYMLARALITNTPEEGPIASEEPLITKMRLLPPDIRFALITYEFEKWPIRWIALAMRTRIPKLHGMLSEARCELCGIGWESLAKEEQACLEAISNSMDHCPNVRINRELSKRIAAFPRVTAIKAQWLELRPELVEVRLRYHPTQTVREQLLNRLLDAIIRAPRPRTPLVDRVVNTVHFSRHGEIKVS